MSRSLMFVIDSLDPIGPAHALSLLIRELVGEFEIIVAVLGDRGASPSRFESIGAKVWLLDSAKLDPLPMRGLAASGYRLRALLKQLRPDLVHAWGSMADSVASIAMGRSSSTPLVRSLIRIPRSNIASIRFLSSIDGDDPLTPPSSIIRLLKQSQLRHWDRARLVDRSVMVPGGIATDATVPH